MPLVFAFLAGLASCVPLILTNAPWTPIPVKYMENVRTLLGLTNATAIKVSLASVVRNPLMNVCPIHAKMGQYVLMIPLIISVSVRQDGQGRIVKLTSMNVQVILARMVGNVWTNLIDILANVIWVIQSFWFFINLSLKKMLSSTDYIEVGFPFSKVPAFFQQVALVNNLTIWYCGR